MKNRILLVIGGIILVAGATFLSLRHWQHYRNLKQHADEVATAQASVQIEQDRKAAAVSQAAIVSAFDKLYGECQKGVVAYNALPAASKAKNAAPVCGAELLQ